MYFLSVQSTSHRAIEIHSISTGVIPEGRNFIVVTFDEPSLAACMAKRLPCLNASGTMFEYAKRFDAVYLSRSVANSSRLMGTVLSHLSTRQAPNSSKPSAFFHSKLQISFNRLDEGGHCAASAEDGLERTSK